jgi:hypothetical protein
VPTSVRNAVAVGVGESAPTGPNADIDAIVSLLGGIDVDFSSAYTDAANVSSVTLRTGNATYGPLTAVGTPTRHTAGDSVEGVAFDGTSYLVSSKAAAAFDFMSAPAGCTTYAVVEFDNLSTSRGVVCTHAGGAGLGMSITALLASNFLDCKVGTGAAQANRTLVGTPFAPNINPGFTPGTRHILRYRASDAAGGAAAVDAQQDTTAANTNSFASGTPQTTLTFAAIGAGTLLLVGKLYRSVIVPSYLSNDDDDTITAALQSLY